MPFEAPTADLSVEDLKRRYGISKQTLYCRKNAADITGKHIKGKTYFTPEEVWCFDQVATFVERGMTLPQIEKLVGEWKEEKAEKTAKTVKQDLTAGRFEEDLRVLTTPPFDAMSVGVPPAPDSETESTDRTNALARFAEREEQAHQLARAFTSAVGQALQDTQQQVVGDPLRTHRLLAEAASAEWVLTGNQLADICGLTTGTISALRPSAVRCGFVLTAIGTGLWEVRKATREEVLEDQESKKRPKPTPPWKAKLEQAEEARRFTTTPDDGKTL